MKKIATLLVLVCLGTGLYAQGLSGGIKAGLNLSNQTLKSDDFTASPSFLPTYHAGVYLTFMFSEKLGLQPEILLSGQGFKDGDTKIKLSYIAVPVMVRFNVNKVLSFHAGPQVGLLASAKADFNGDKIDVKDGYKGVDFGVGLGTTVDLPMGLNFTARFIQGLSNVAETDDDDDYTVKNYALQVSVGYTLFGRE